MKRHSQRAQRVGEQIQRELAQMLREQVKDPRVGPRHDHRGRGLADLSHAKVFSHRSRGSRARRGVGARAPSAPRVSCAPSSRTGEALLGAPSCTSPTTDSIESGIRLSKLIDEAVAADHKPNA
jgi:ribosome-binding factor A